MADLTPKQEAFAQVYVETGNASEAYRQAYDVSDSTKPESVWQEASRVLADLKVSSRVIGLQEEARERHSVTIDSLTLELNENRKLAKNEKQSAAMTAATMGKAKLHGLLSDKVEHSNPDGSLRPKIVELVCPSK